jgi:glycosyltransferase involved in cell wall biosynthesis
MTRRALYVSHTGLSEPLGRSQVLPYLRGLSRAGWDIDVVAFEPEGAEVRDLDLGPIRYSFARRSSSHALPVKLAEAAGAFLRLMRRALASRPDIVHARSHLPGAVALALTRMLPRARLLFDCRGLLADEYVDAGHWRSGSLEYRLVKRAERLLFSRAHGVVTLTERLREWLKDHHLLGSRVETAVIPCCVDLSRFSPSESGRADSRQRLNAKDRFVLAYSGSLNSWYCEEQMARFYAAVRRQRPSRFAVFTRSPSEKLRASLRAAGVPDEEVHIEAVPPSDMPARLSGADGAVSFIQPCFSKMASSPTKVGEYLALGLPVAMNRGVGDVDRLLGDAATVDAGAMRDDELERAASRIVSLHVGAEARALAQREFSVEEGVARYRELYQKLALPPQATAA